MRVHSHGSPLKLPQPLEATKPTTRRASPRPPTTHLLAQCAAWNHLAQPGLGESALLCTGGSGLPIHPWLELGWPAQCRLPPEPLRACGGMPGRRFLNQAYLRNCLRSSCRRSPESCELQR
eukprot:1747707-Amphidinium_carterae.1